MRKLFVYCSLLFVFIISCINVSGGLDGATGTMAESKEMGLFECEYYIWPNNTITLGDSVKIKATEIWKEKCWKHGTNRGEFSSDGSSASQILIRVQDTLPKSYGTTWYIGLNQYFCIRWCGYNTLITDLSPDESALDTLRYQIQRGYDLDERKDSLKEVIGEVILIKKK